MKYNEFERFYKFIDNFSNRFKRSFIEGFASGIAINNDINNVIEISGQINNRYREDYFKGIGFTFGLQAVPDLTVIKEIGEKIDENYRNYYYKGIGKAVSWHFVNDPTLILKLIAADVVDIDFKIREYTLLPLGVYKYLDDTYKGVYCQGLGYGLAPYLFGGMMPAVLRKLGGLLSSKDYLFLLKGVCFYYNERGGGIDSCKRVSDVELSKKLQDIYVQVFDF